MLMIVVSKSTKISKNHHLRNVIYSHQDQEHENSHNQQKHGSNNNQALGDLMCQCEQDRGGVLSSSARQHASLGSRRSKIEHGIDQKGSRTNCLIKLRGGRSDLDEVAFQHLGGGGGDQMIDSGGSDH